MRLFRVAMVVMVLIWGWGLAGEERCESRAEMMGTDHHHDIWTGCMVKVDSGDWVPLGNVRVNEWGEELGDE